MQSKGAYLYYSWEYFPKPENRTKKNQTDSQNPNGSYFVLRTQKLASAEINKTTTYVNGRVSRKGSIRDRKPELLLPLLFLASHLPLLLLAVPTEREISFFFFFDSEQFIDSYCERKISFAVTDVFSVILTVILNYCRCRWRLLNEQAYYVLVYSLEQRVKCSIYFNFIS